MTVTQPQTERPRGGLRPGHWVLIGIAVLLVLGAGITVAVVRGHRSTPPPAAQPGTGAPSSSATAPGKTCVPVVTESGFNAVRKVVRFGLVVTSSCSQAAVNTVIGVDALDADGVALPVAGGPDPSIVLPVLLPGQRTSVGGEIFLAGPATTRKLKISVSGTQNIPVSEFASWARSVTVTGLQHTGPDGHGLTDVSGTVTADPPGTALCNPVFYLVLRDAKNTIVYGQRARQDQPIFSGDLPPNVDWHTAQISVVQGRATLGYPSGATLSCRNP